MVVQGGAVIVQYSFMMLERDLMWFILSDVEDESETLKVLLLLMRTKVEVVQ